MSKMKLLSSFQLATLFTKQRCTPDFLHLLRDDMNSRIRHMVKLRPNMNKMAIILRPLMKLVHC